MPGGCLVCRVHAGELRPPGGMLVTEEHWAVAHSLEPVVLPGQLVLTLRRHCERLADVTAVEAAALGPLLRRAVRAIDLELGPERVPVGSYNEGIRHVHVLVTPRVAGMPAGNGATFAWLKGRQLLHRARLVRAAPDTELHPLVERLRDRLAS